MTDVPGRSARDPSESSSFGVRLAPRHVGDYLLVAQLGDDALGSVYRALHTSNGHFVRLRALQSPELSPRDVLAAAQRLASRQGVARPGEDGRHGEIQIADGAPYLIWPETNGWTLDFVLARARAGGWGMPIEFALLIAERAAARIEQESLCTAPGEPAFHGALWPGFVSISSDAEVRVEGFAWPK